MKNNKYKIFSILSLVALLILQLFWIYNMYSMQAEQLSKECDNVLNKAMSKDVGNRLGTLNS